MTLVVLRTLIGWHFLYEGYTKLLQPAWGRAGAPVAAWSSAGYLKAATGPLADVFHSLGNASWIGTLDLVVAALLVAVGLSLMLGLFTQAGCAGALGLLAMFYLSAIPMGLPEATVRGHVPHRQQEPDRGCGGARAVCVPHRPHRRARFLLGVAPCRIGSAGVSRARRESRSDPNEGSV